MVSYNHQPAGQPLDFIGVGEIQLAIRVDPVKKNVAWFKGEKELMEMKIPATITPPYNVFFSLKDKNDWA